MWKSYSIPFAIPVQLAKLREKVKVSNSIKMHYVCGQEHSTENMRRRLLIGALFAMAFYYDSGSYKCATHSHF